MAEFKPPIATKLAFVSPDLVVVIRNKASIASRQPGIYSTVHLLDRMLLSAFVFIYANTILHASAQKSTGFSIPHFSAFLPISPHWDSKVCL